MEILGSSEAGGVLAESWVLSGKWDNAGFDLQRLFLNTAQGGPVIRQTMLDVHCKNRASRGAKAMPSPSVALLTLKAQMSSCFFCSS